MTEAVKSAATAAELKIKPIRCPMMNRYQVLGLDALSRLGSSLMGGGYLRPMTTPQSKLEPTPQARAITENLPAPFMGLRKGGLRSRGVRIVHSPRTGQVVDRTTDAQAHR